MLDKSLIDNLKRVDPDRYRAALFAEKADRDALLALYAFHAELAKVPELVSETMIGNIRYQWWRDAIDEIFSDKPVRKHEVATPLAQITKDRDISRYWLDKLIDGRERDLDPQPFEALENAREYCRNTSGALLVMAAHMLDSNADQDAMLSLGEAWGLTGLARSWKYYQNGMLSGLKFDQILTASKDKRDEAAALIPKINPKLMPAICYVSLIPKFSAIMAQDSFDPNSQTPDYPVFSKKFRLMRAVLSGKI